MKFLLDEADLFKEPSVSDPLFLSEVTEKMAKGQLQQKLTSVNILVSSQLDLKQGCSTEITLVMMMEYH